MSNKQVYIEVPDPIQIMNKLKPGEVFTPLAKNPITGTVTEEKDTPWSFYRWILIFVFQRPGWDKPLERLRVKGRTLNAVEAFEDNPPVRRDGRRFLVLNAEPHETIATWIKDKESEFKMDEPYGSQLLPHLEAFLNPLDELPDDLPEPG